MRACKTCGVDLTGSHWRVAYCDKCRTGTCAKCGKEYAYRVPSHPSKYCGRACTRNNAARDYIMSHHDEYTAVEIAKILGISKQRVSQLSKKLGVTTRSGWAK